MNVKGTYTIKENMGSYDLEIDYKYYWKEQTHEHPFEDNIEIKEVRLNAMDITTFYIDFLCDEFHDKVWRYAYQNKYENHE